MGKINKGVEGLFGWYVLVLLNLNPWLDTHKNMLALKDEGFVETDGQFGKMRYICGPKQD